MRVGKLRKIAKTRWSWIPTGFLGVIWIVVLWASFRSYSEPEWIDEDIYLSYIDRNLLLLDAGRGEGSFIEWWAGAEDEEETLGDLLDAIPVNYEWESWDGEFAELALKRRLAKLQNKAPPAVDWQGYEREAIREVIYNSHTGAYIAQLYLDENDDDGVRALLEERQEKIMWRSFWMPIFYHLILLLLPLTAWLYFREKNEAVPQHRLIGSWRPSLLLGVFFAAQLLGSLFSCVISPLFLLDWGYRSYWWFSLIYDTTWRAIPAVLLCLFFYRSMGRAVRSLFMRGRFCLAQLLVAFAGLQLVGWLLWLIPNDSLTDPEDIISAAMPDNWDLFANLWSAVVMAPVMEELVFRGFLLLGLRRQLGNGWALLLSSCAFTFVHVQYVDVELLSVGLFGIACGWLTLRTGSLKTSVALHMIYNLTITADVYFFYQMNLGG